MSSVELVASVANGGVLGSFRAHQLPAGQIGALAAAIRSDTERPFALNLWVNGHDPGGKYLDAAQFDRVWRVFEAYFQELGLPRPEPPAQFHLKFEEQVEALLAAEPAAFSFVFGTRGRPFSSTVVAAAS